MATNLQTRQFSSSAPRAWTGGTVRSGYGTDQLHLGMLEGQAQKVFGVPAKTARVEQHRFWVYPQLGLDVEFLGGRITGIFFFRKGEENHFISASVALFPNVRFNLTRSEVTKSLGQPIAEAILPDGRSWITFAGVQLDFDKDARLSRITIY